MLNPQSIEINKYTMVNYYTSKTCLIRNISRLVCAVLFLFVTVPYAKAQTICPDPGGGRYTRSLGSTTARSIDVYPGLVPSGQSGQAKGTIGYLINYGDATLVYPANTVTINPLLNGVTGYVALKFELLSLVAAQAKIEIFQGTSAIGSPVITLTEANRATYEGTSVVYNGPVTVRFTSPTPAASGNFDFEIRYMTGDQLLTSNFNHKVAVWTAFIQPDSYTFIDDFAVGTANTLPISIGHFDASRNFVSAEIGHCLIHDRDPIGAKNTYPGEITLAVQTDKSNFDRLGSAWDVQQLKMARVAWIIANAPKTTRAEMLDVRNAIWTTMGVDYASNYGGLHDQAMAAVPTVPTASPAAPSLSMSTSTPSVGVGAPATFTLNVTGGTAPQTIKLDVPADVTINSVTGASYSGGDLTISSLPASVQITATSSTTQSATLKAIFGSITDFYDPANFKYYVPCEKTGHDPYQDFVGYSVIEQMFPTASASATWQNPDLDYGDLPDSYSTVAASNGPSHEITAYNATAHTSSLMLGSLIDSETDGVVGGLADGDNLADVNDEDAITQFPVLVLGQTNYSVTFPVTNTTGATATVKGWIDFNRDGAFGAGEEATQTVADGGTSVTLTWPSFTAAATAGTVYARFRIASVASEITSPTGTANSGEVEDYRLFIGVTVAGTVFNDADNDRIIDSGENFTSLPVPMYVYMVNSNVIVDAATVAANGSYLLTAPANGTSTVHLSTQQYPIGTDISASPIDHTAPTGWKTTGENAGGNNNATTNDSNADGILTVTVTNVNLVNRNFGIRQLTAGNSGGYDICASDRSILPLSDFITGQDLGGTWSHVSGSGITFDPVAGTIQLTSSATTSTYRYDLGGSFSIATVTVRQLPVKTQNITICEGQTYCLTNPVGNARVIAPGQTYCHTTSGVYTDTLSLAGQYGCDSIVVTTLTVVPTPNAGADGDTTACTNDATPIDLFSLITGEQTGGTWARTSGTGGTFDAATGTFTPAVGATTSTFGYTITSAGSCGTDVSVATVTLNACALQISGTVFNDANGLAGSPANTIDGTPIQSAGSAPLYANLVMVGPAAPVVVASVPINASGNYSFPVDANSTYTVFVSTQVYAVGSTMPSSAILPNGWVNTGEFVGSGAGNDMTPDGFLAVNVGTTSVTNANFGLDQQPNSNSVTHVLPTQPAVGAEFILDGTDAPLMSGSDPEDGTYSGNTATPGNDPQGVIITSLPTHGELWYYGFGTPVMVSATDVTNGTLFPDPSLFAVVLTGVGYTSTTFEYAYVDAAGAIDPTPATYTISWEKPLPVTLISFNTYSEGSAVNLKWSTASETNSKGFDIERSANASSWTKIGFVDAQSQGASTTSKLDYHFSDVKPFNGLNYYRLKMVDLDGTFAYSQIRTVNLEGMPAVAIYPNPTAGKVYLQNIDLGKVTKVSISSIDGKYVHNYTAITSDGIDVGNLIPGLYVISITGQGQVQKSLKLFITR